MTGVQTCALPIYLIKLDDVTYNNSSLSDTLLKYRSKNVVITLETIMPKWKEQLLNVGKKTGNWIKGFNDFINKPSFLRAMSGVAFINLTLTIKTNENNLIKYFDVLGTITYLFTLNQKAVEKFAPKFAGTIISKAVFSKATTVFFVASAIVDAITLYNKNQTTAGLFALISGLTAFIGAISIISSGPIGWILIFISISTSIIVE